jgi:hypothetical protein
VAADREAEHGRAAGLPGAAVDAPLGGGGRKGQLQAARCIDGGEQVGAAVRTTGNDLAQVINPEGIVEEDPGNRGHQGVEILHRATVVDDERMTEPTTRDIGYPDDVTRLVDALGAAEIALGAFKRTQVDHHAVAVAEGVALVVGGA